MDVMKFGKFDQPGHRLTATRTTRSQRVGWGYVHTFVDDSSRLAYSEVLEDETAVTVTAFTRRALVWFDEHGIFAERLMTDNGFSYVKNRSFTGTTRKQGNHARQYAPLHVRTRLYTSRTNGKFER